MRCLQLNPWRIFLLSGLLTGSLATLSSGEDSEKKQPERAIQAKTTSGPFTIIVDRVRWDFGKGISMAPSGLPMQMQKTFEKNETNVFEDHKPGGTPDAPTATVTRGMTSSGGAGGGGGMGGAFLRPNLILDVEVKNPKLTGSRQLICMAKEKVRAQDDLGRQLDSADLGPPMRMVLPGVEYPQGNGRMALHLYVPLDPAARYIQSIEGDLVVAEGSISNATFKGPDLTKQTPKRPGGGAVRLSRLQQSGEGIDVGIIAPPPNASKAQSPLERMQSMMGSGDRISVVLEDSNGELHPSVGSSMEDRSNNSSSETKKLPGGGTSTTTIHRSSSGGMMSGSSSGGGSGGGTFNMGSGGMNPKPKKTGPSGPVTGWKSPRENLPTQNFHFDPLPEGVKVKAIRCTITDGVGPAKSIPFRLENIRLPAR
jgi:hypothetical protein